MKIEISNGELLDKLSILEIKRDKIRDPEKLANVNGEYSLIKPLGDKLISSVQSQYENLLQVNRFLWDIEDTIRDLERARDFGEKFISTARKVYQLNDERARLKKEINLLTKSGLIEEKSYTEY